MAGVYIVARSTSKGRSFHVKYRLEGRYGKIHHAGAFRTRREAELRAAKVREWVALALDPRVELARASTAGATVGETCRVWLAGKRRISDVSRANYQAVIDMIDRDRVLGEVSVEALGVRDVVDWVGRLEVRYRPATVAKYVMVLRAALDVTGLPNVARDRRVELPARAGRVLRPPDAAETLAVLARVHARQRPVCVLMEQCGLRVSEACAVRETDVDRGGFRLLVPVSKTGRPRWVPVPRWLVGLLEPPWPVTRQTVHNALKNACVDAGVPSFGPHMLRHRRASLWHLQGVPAVEAAAWLGHSPREHLNRYAHVMPVREIEAHRLALLLR